MKYSKLGRTGLDCSRLGFGTWQIGGGRWKHLESNESIQLLKHAADTGINVFDAAFVYGQYRGEFGEQRSQALELLGKAFGGQQREEVIICLKVGQLDEFSHRAVYEPRHLVEQIKAALKQARTEYFDICLIHAPTISEIKDGRALAVIQTVQAMGIAKFVGYSFETEPEHAMLALNQGVDVMMLQYNLLDAACETAFTVAAERGVGILVGGPFKRGYLSGRYEKPEDLPLQDNYWAWNLRYSRMKVEELLSAAARLKQQAGSARDLRKQGLHYILRHQSACSAVVGHRSKEEVTENAAVLEEIAAGLNHTPIFK